MNSMGHAAVDGNSSLQMGDRRTEIHNYNEPNRNRCIEDLRLTDPHDDKARIEQTKGGLLKDSYKWIFQHADYQRWHDDEESRLLLFSGDAGKGKTMLLCGIIDEISSHLLSFFFCQGSDSRFNSATAVLRGLIYLLLIQQETLALHLRKRYEHAHRLFDDTNAFYTFSQVLVEILHDPSLRGAYSIIDGLDECQAGLPQLLDFIVRNTSIPRVKWIVSSRNRYDIQQRLYLNNYRIRLSLEGNADDVSKAVEVYIDYKLSCLTSLKDNTSLQDQVRDQMRQKANGTFLWAALVFQELQEVQTWDVLRVVEELPADLVPLYDRMTKQIQQLKRQDYEFCQLVLSTVALSFRPLRLLELGILSGLPGWMIPSISSIVEMCGSFLTIKDDYIYLIHQSANDYLRTNAPAAIFPPGSRDVHHRIFSQSLQAMSILRRDMYNLCHPGISIDQATKFAPDADSLATVRYACVYWVDHLSRYQNALCNNGDVHVFLRDSFLYWFEALGLMGRISDGVVAITKLVKLLEGVSSESEVVKLARDAWSFILLNRTVIENTPLQAYVSALLFSQAHNLIGKLFRREEPRWITIVERSGTPDRHTDSVNAVIFSHDSHWLVSASDDSTVRVWDAETGCCLKTLEGHMDSVRSIAFSHDSRQLASASNDKTLRIWDTETGNRCCTTGTSTVWLWSWLE
ncbi:hypothetical protein BKA56DRAFT_638112 [Ilyonectria sp. MPI-CAGE-AT-0026]|nr:hypothetical protein BKA56DRAFT_638112 [Ilyonectria sp. MPI-CAGE-AT-0026]